MLRAHNADGQIKACRNAIVLTNALNGHDAQQDPFRAACLCDVYLKCATHKVCEAYTLTKKSGGGQIPWLALLLSVPAVWSTRGERLRAPFELV
jgi:hypothetical protein